MKKALSLLLSLGLAFSLTIMTSALSPQSNTIKMSDFQAALDQVNNEYGTNARMPEVSIKTRQVITPATLAAFEREIRKTAAEISAANQQSEAE